MNFHICHDKVVIRHQLVFALLQALFYNSPKPSLSQQGSIKHIGFKMLIFRVNPLSSFAIWRSICLNCRSLIYFCLVNAHLISILINRKSIIKKSLRFNPTERSNIVLAQFLASPTLLLWDVSVINKQSTIFFCLLNSYHFPIQLISVIRVNELSMIDISVFERVKHINWAFHIFQYLKSNRAFLCFEVRTIAFFTFCIKNFGLVNFKGKKGSQYEKGKKKEKKQKDAYHQSSGIENKLVLLLKQKLDNCVTISLRLRLPNFYLWLPILILVQLIKKSDIHNGYVIIFDIKLLRQFQGNQFEVYLSQLFFPPAQQLYQHYMLHFFPKSYYSRKSTIARDRQESPSLRTIVLNQEKSAEIRKEKYESPERGFIPKKNQSLTLKDQVFQRNQLHYNKRAEPTEKKQKTKHRNQTLYVKGICTKPQFDFQLNSTKIDQFRQVTTSNCRRLKQIPKNKSTNLGISLPLREKQLRSPKLVKRKSKEAYFRGWEINEEEFLQF